MGHVTIILTCQRTLTGRMEAPGNHIKSAMKYLEAKNEMSN